jgi:hypothetical protein
MADREVNLRDAEPLVDLRDAPSVRFSDPPPFEATAGGFRWWRGRRATTAPPLAVVERRDAIQQARFIAVVIIAVLNGLDLITTYVALARGAHEGNPIVAWMISSRVVVLAKVFLCGMLILGALVARDRRHRVTLAGLCTAWAVVGVYSLVVLINTVSVWSRL